MKKFLALCAAALLLSPAVSSAKDGNKGMNTSDAATMKVLYAALRSRVFVQVMVKDYLYIGNNVAASKASSELKRARTKLEAQRKILKRSLSDKKMKNLLAFLDMNIDEIEEAIRQPYSLDRASEVIDLGEAVAEGNKKIADLLRKSLSKDYPTGKGQRYMLNQIAKYYIAWQAGIRDDVTVRQMNKVVARFDKVLEEMKNYPKNTIAANQVLNDIDRLWGIVKQFYIDIHEGGLPLIVYQTTRKLDALTLQYSRLITPQSFSKESEQEK
jgi:hypothetical protein